MEVTETRLHVFSFLRPPARRGGRQASLCAAVCRLWLAEWRAGACDGACLWASAGGAAFCRRHEARELAFWRHLLRVRALCPGREVYLHPPDGPPLGEAAVKRIARRSRRTGMPLAPERVFFSGRWLGALRRRPAAR